MAQDDAIKSKPFDVAAIDGVLRNDVKSLGRVQSQHELKLRWDHDRAILSVPHWHSAGWHLRVAILQAALALFGCIKGAPEPLFHWLFSGKVVRRQDVQSVLEQWMQDGAPPVMDIVDFIVDGHGNGTSIRTHGLHDLVGHEIEARIGDPAHQELARMVGLLAQETLAKGAIRANSAIGPDGTEYRLSQIQGLDVRGPSIEIIEKPSRGDTLA